MLNLLRQLLTALLLVFIYCNFTFAQIGGVVVHSTTLTPIANVNVNILNELGGTSTNKDGRFFINWSNFPIEVEFSVLGFETKYIIIENPHVYEIIYLDPIIMDLEQIVVVPDRVINPITKSSSIARSTVSIEQLSNKSVTTAVELLRAETGVYVQQTSIGQGSLYIRGRAGRDVLYLFNGFRMNPSFIRSGQSQYFGAIDPLLINKLDVYRGPVSVYYGSDALSGGVNISPIIKKFSSDKIVTGEISSFLNFEGNGEKSVHSKLAYEGPRFTLFAGGSYRDYDYYNMSSKSNKLLWFPYDETLSNADYQFKSFQLSSNIKLTDTSYLTMVSYSGQIPDAPRLDRQTLGFSIENTGDALIPRNGYYSNTSPLVFWANTIELKKINKARAFQNVVFKTGFFRLKDFRKQNNYDLTNTPKYTIISDHRDYSFSINDTTNYDRSSSNQWLMSVDIQSKINENFYLKWGGDISYDFVHSKRFTNVGEEQLSRYPNGSKYLLTGIFAQVDFALSNRVTLEYGTRFSHTFTDIPFEGLNSDRKFDPYSDTYSHITQALGLSYNVTDHLVFLSNISTGFRAPNIADLSEVGSRRNNQFQTPSIELKPEKTRNFDIGFIFDNDKYRIEVYTFWLHYFDKITRIETGNYVNYYGQIIPQDSINNSNSYIEVRNLNANSMDLLGLEFTGSYTNNDHLHTGFTFTYAWGNLLNTDGSKEPVDRIPPANGIFYVDYSIGKNISIRPQARYAFSHRRISQAEKNDNRISQNGTDGFLNFQLFINIYSEKNITTKFIADNIMDQAYREHASSLDGMGRNFTISLTYTF